MIFALLEEFFSLLSSRGMRPGRAARRVFGPDADIDSLAELAGLEFNLAGDVVSFRKAYDDVRSCMQSRGADVHDFYAKLGVEVATLADETGKVVARALVCENRYNTCYGVQHHVLEALLLASGYHQCQQWLGGAKVRLPKPTTVPVFHGVYETRGYYVDQFHWHDGALKAALKRGWLPREDEEVVKGSDSRVVAPSGLLQALEEGWTPLGRVECRVRVQTRVLGRVVRVADPQVSIWVDGYGPGAEGLVEYIDEDEDLCPRWHRYDWLEEEMGVI